MKIKELRQKINKTQQEVANDLYLQKQTYQNYELGKRMPDLETLKKLADYFNVSLDYLCEHETKHVLDTSNWNEYSKNLVSVIQELNETNNYILLGYANRLLSEQNNKKQ